MNKVSPKKKVIKLNEADKRILVSYSNYVVEQEPKVIKEVKSKSNDKILK